MFHYHLRIATVQSSFHSRRTSKRTETHEVCRSRPSQRPYRNVQKTTNSVTKYDPSVFQHDLQLYNWKKAHIIPLFNMASNRKDAQWTI